MHVKQRMLIIEDDLSIAAMYEMKLKSAGYNVSVAHNGVEGLSLIQELKPDLVLLDIKMPEMNGDEMLEKLRATQWGANIRVIILTNLSKDEAPHTLRLLNVERYIVKAHYTPSQVTGIVDDILSDNKDH